MQKHHITIITSIVIVLVAIIVGVISYNQTARESALAEGGERETLKREILDIQPGDHIYGERDATIKLIKYSDTDCQYCRPLYFKLKNIVDDYNGQVAFVYRPIPIYYYRGEIDNTEFAAECVAREKGDDGYFTFLDTLFSLLPPNVETKDVAFETLAFSADASGVQSEKLEACIQDEYGRENIETSHNSGGVLGVLGIPHVFIVSPTERYDLTRDQAETVYREIIDSMLEAK